MRRTRIRYKLNNVGVPVEQWRQIEKLYHAALERHPSQREAFLAQAAEDEEVRREVASLLAQNPSDGLLGEPAWKAAIGMTGVTQTRTVESADKPFTPGTVLGQRYRIATLLGKGGMGEVYRATDLLLDQEVALKFLPMGLLLDAGAQARMYNEVKLARTISHRNVCRVYDIGEAEGRPFLSMEYIDGEDLAGLLRRIGRLPPDKAIGLAIDLSMALGAAHAAGVLHRDLKPGNIMIDRHGEVRILDFGLAAMTGNVTDCRSGTPRYMAPEQRAGREVTEQSDLYSLGLVIHEVFTGKLPDRGGQPSFDSVPGIDQAVQDIVCQCLQTEPRKRPSSATAVAAAIAGENRLAGMIAAGETPSPDGRIARAGISNRTAFMKWPVLVISILVGIGAGILWFSRSSPSRVPRLVPLTFYPELEEQPSLSPDGSQVAFRWKSDIYVQQTGSEAFLQITKDPGDEFFPSWSPDGNQISFVRSGAVFVVSRLGGAERKIAESNGRAVWMPDGSALLVLMKTSQNGQSVFRFSLATGEQQRLTFPKEPSPGDTDMAPSPDGQSIAFCRTLTGEGCDLFVIPAGGGEPQRLTNEHKVIMGFAWTPDSREIVFASNRQGGFRLWRIRARPTALGSYANPEPVSGAGDDARYPTISQNGRFVYQKYTRNFYIKRAEITGAEGTASHHLGVAMPFITSTRTDVTPAWSPDGKKIAFRSDRSGSPELWLCDADGSNALKLTSFDGPQVILPRWSPDSSHLVFSAVTGSDGNFEGYLMDARGGRPERIHSPGHRTMAHPVFSHDGRWIYFIPGPQDGPVEAFKMPANGGEAVQITRNGAFRPEDSPDGALLYYGKLAKRGIWSTPVAGGPEEQVIAFAEEASWTVVSSGIYYLEAAKRANEPVALKFYSFAAKLSNQIGTVEASVLAGFRGISISPDGRWLLYSYVANVSSDLMMLVNFR